jgi:hypothetical protein
MKANAADPDDDFAKWLTSTLDDLNAQAVSFGVSRVERRRMVAEVRVMLVAAASEAMTGEAVEVCLFHTGPGKVRVTVVAGGGEPPLCDHAKSNLGGLH